VIGLIRDLIRPYRWMLLAVLCAMIVETAMSLAGPWPLKVVLDNVVDSRRLPLWVERFAPGATTGRIALWAGAFTVAIAVIGAAAAYLDTYWSESVAQSAAHDLRMRTYHHLQRLSLSYYDKHQVSASLSTLTTDIETVQNFASSGTLAIIIDALSVVGMFAVMALLDWDFTLIAAGVAPVLLLFIYRVKRGVKKATSDLRQNQAKIVALEMYGLQSQRAIEAFGTQDLEEARLSKASRSAVQSALRARRIKSSLAPGVSLPVACCMALVLWRGAGLVTAGAMTAGSLTVFLAYLSRFFKPVQDLAKMTSSVVQTSVATERLRSILETDEILPERRDAQIPASLRGEIVFDHVAFRYESDAPVLRDVSFRVEPGEFVGLVGRTGSGKSTVLSLIPRFYDASGGRVLIDGLDVRDYQLRGLRKKFAFVLQDTVLFRGTVYENIAYGRPNATAEEIVRAAQLANASEFIERMPHRYDTMVGEQGLTLSGGQRQRLGIARAIVRNSSILILDEPTAALDQDSEQRVIEALERLMEGRTVIMVAHRLATLQRANKVIVLKDGLVAEEGSPNRLLGSAGAYAQLLKEQQAQSADALG
jgi:ABC-type multidrug transport system fused ATPase/permease subunit